MMNKYFEEQERTFQGKVKNPQSAAPAKDEAAFGTVSAYGEDTDTPESGVSQALPADVGQECTLYANFFKIINDPKLTLSWLVAKVQPELPEGEMRQWMLRKIFRTLGKPLRELLPWHVRIGLNIYAPSKHCPVEDDVVLGAEIEGQDYRITISVHTKTLLWSEDLLLYHRVMQRVFDQIYGSLRFQRVGRGLFDMSLVRENELLGIDIWPGHQAQLTIREDEGLMLQVTSEHQVVHRAVSVLDKIRMIRESNEARGRDYQQEVMDAVIGQDIVTVYNRRAYRIDDIAFDKTPESTFTLLSQGDEFHVSFADYLRSQHKVDVLEPDQPMLVVYDIGRE